MASSSTPREPLVPTINFSMVCPGVYRSGYPTKKNYSFLCALRLRSILYLCPEDYAESNLKFCEENGIHVLRFPTEGNKEPFNDISEPLMHRILGAICDTRNLPLLIHCNKGKHRTGTVVSCLRHLQGWSLVSIFEEYKRFASDKARVGDQQYVELYHPIVKLTPPFVAAWVTITPRVTLVTSDRELMEAETIQLGTSLLAPDKPEKAAKKAKAATAVPATAVAATTGAMTSTSPIMQSAPPTTAAPPPLPPAALSSSAASSAGGAAGALPHVLSSVSGSLPPTSPPPSGSKQQQQLLDVPISTHAISSNGTTANAAGPSVSAGTGAGTAVPTATTTTTTTNVKTNTTAAAGDGASGGGVASPAAGSAGNGSAPGSSGHHSSGSVGKGMSTSASWHSPTSAPPSAVFTTVPQSSTSAHSGGGANGSTGSANSQSSIPPLDKEMRL